MRSARNQLILLGFICQGLSWDDYFLPLLNVALWVACLTLPRKPVRLGPLVECSLLAAGCAAGYFLGAAAGRSTHFFIGHGLTWMQAARLLRPLDRREQIFSLLMACFQLAVGCTFLFDYRFIPILLGAVVLLPKALLELEAGSFLNGPAPKPAALTPAFYAIIAAVMVAFFVAFPRALVGSPLQYTPQRSGDDSTLLESVLDPTGGGAAQSGLVLLQIAGEQLGYLRCLALRDFDGTRWYAEKLPGLRNFAPLPSGQPDDFNLRRVRVKRVAFLGRILPTDGQVVSVSGKFFRRAFLSTYGMVECDFAWNTANNAYEYRILRKPKPERLSPAMMPKYTNYPPQSARLRGWLEDVMAGETNRLAQAHKLESYLRSHFSYKLGAPELSRVRPIDDFIFNLREGHCERFAAALALLLRMEGIPTRIVIGYLPTSRNRFTGWYNIRFKDAHAWTEAYFKDRGWVQLDATPGAPEEVTGWNLGDLVETLDVIWYSSIVNFDGATQKYLFTVSAQALARFPGWIRQNPNLLWQLALAFAPLIAWQLHRRRRRPPRPAGPVRDQTRLLANHYYGQMLRALERLGCHRRPQQTPFEFLGNLEQRSLPVLTEARLITEIFCATRYGKTAIAQAQQVEIEDALRRIKMAGTPAARS